jgi:hypothetical protein
MIPDRHEFIHKAHRVLATANTPLDITTRSNMATITIVGDEAAREKYFKEAREQAKQETEPGVIWIPEDATGIWVADAMDTIKILSIRLKENGKMYCTTFSPRTGLAYVSNALMILFTLGMSAAEPSPQAMLAEPGLRVLLKDRLKLQLVLPYLERFL